MTWPSVRRKTRLTIVVAMTGALLPTAPAVAANVLQKERTIATTPFVNSDVQMKDGEGMAYVNPNDTLWLADDNGKKIYEMARASGVLLSSIPASVFAQARRFGRSELAGLQYTKDMEALAYDSLNDHLYLYSAACCPNPPAAFRLTRSTPTSSFTVESFQPIPVAIDPTGGAFHPTEGVIYLATGKSDIARYDYETNTVGPAVPMEQRGGIIYGLGFTPDGTKLWVVTSKNEVYRLDWATKRVDTDYVFDLLALSDPIRDARAVELIDGKLYILDGDDNRSKGDPLRYAVSVFRVVPTPTTPAAPTNLVAAVNSDLSVSLTWVDNAGNEDGFTVERCEGAGCSHFLPIQTLGQNVMAYRDQGLSLGLSYSYRVQAFNDVGGSAYSNAETVTVGPPPAPTALTVTGVGINSIDLAWLDTSDNESGFTIERCQGTASSCVGGAWITLDPSPALGPDTQSFSDSGLAADTSYSYRVRAHNAYGPSEAAGPVTGKTLAEEVNLLANPGFELDVDGNKRPDSWGTESAKFTRSNEVVRSGSYAGKFSAIDDPNGKVTSQSVAVDAGTTYTFDGCVNIPSTTVNMTFTFEVKWKKATGAGMNTVVVGTYTETDAWRCVSGTMVAPAQAAQADVRMNVSPGTYTIYVDDLAFSVQ
jgi:hypothetical protein